MEIARRKASEDLNDVYIFTVDPNVNEFPRIAREDEMRESIDGK